MIYFVYLSFNRYTECILPSALLAEQVYRDIACFCAACDDNIIAAQKILSTKITSH